MHGHGQGHAAGIADQRGSRNSRVCRGLLVKRSDMNSGGRGDGRQLQAHGHPRDAGKVVDFRPGKTFNDKTDQEDKHAARDGGGDAWRGTPVVRQTPQPKADVQSLALAEEHRFGVELIDRPTNRQEASGQGHAEHDRQVLQRLPVGASIVLRSKRTTPVMGMRLFPRFSSTPGAIGRTASGVVTRSKGTR